MKVLEKTKRWTKAMIDMVLLMFEQMSYGEYMAFDPMRDFEDFEEKKKFD